MDKISWRKTPHSNSARTYALVAEILLLNFDLSSLTSSFVGQKRTQSMMRNMRVIALSAAHAYMKTYVTYQTRSSADADNGLDAFSGQSRPTNMVPFHMLHIVSYCAIVTLSLRCAVFTIFVFKKIHDLEMGSKVTQGHWEWYHSIDCVWFPISVL